MYPGGPKSLIYDRRVWNGGESDRKVEELRLGMEEGGRRKREGEGERGSGIGRGTQVNPRVERRSQGYMDDGSSQAGYRGDRRSEMSEGLGPRRSILGEMSGRR